MSLPVSVKSNTAHSHLIDWVIVSSAFIEQVDKFQLVGDHAVVSRLKLGSYPERVERIVKRSALENTRSASGEEAVCVQGGAQLVLVCRGNWGVEWLRFVGRRILRGVLLTLRRVLLYMLDVVSTVWTAHFCLGHLLDMVPLGSLLASIALVVELHLATQQSEAVQSEGVSEWLQIGTHSVCADGAIRVRQLIDKLKRVGLSSQHLERG